MGRGMIEGVCHLCGEQTMLSFEHVPPKAAFNDKTVMLGDIEKILASDTLEDPTPKQKQGGFGKHTLCRRCNSNTGDWYARDFVEWAYQAMHLLHKARVAPSLHYPFYIRPANVLKQIICMFMSVNASGFQNVHPELVKYVLDRHEKYLPDKYRFYSFYNCSARSRWSGVTAQMTLGKSNIVMCEIAAPPLGFVLLLEGSKPHPALLDITHFSKFNYREICAPMFLKMPVLPIHSIFPGDYRSKEEIERDRLAEVS